MRVSSEARIQWKGTDVCMDFYCACGAASHGDGLFAYYVRCPRCGVTYRMGTKVTVEATVVDDVVDSVLDLQADP